MPTSSEARARFVTFAFACADLLVETEETGRIVFAAGAARRFAGLSAEALVGRDLAALVAPSDRGLVRQLLRRAAAGARVGPTRIGSPSREMEATLRALAAPGTGRIALAFADIRPATGDPGTGPHGLLDRQALEASIRHHLGGAEPAVADPHLSLLTLDGLELARARLPQEMVEEVTATIAAVLRAASIDGRAAGELAPGRYAVLHAHAAGGEEIEREVREVIDGAGLAGEIGVERRSLPLLEPTLGLREISEALAHTLASFATQTDGAVPRSLADALGERLRATMQRVEAVRSTIQAARFDIVYQPVVRLPGREIHHYEALTRFGGDATTAETIGFAEQAGLVAELDLLVLRRVLRRLAEMRRGGAPPRVAVNLSARSLASDGFVEALRRSLRDCGVPARDLLFEITESYEIRDLPRADAILASLRSAGHQVCLDDFGAGASAFQYIRHLGVDFVKLDGSYTGRLPTSPRDVSIVGSVIGLCTGLGVPVIAEMVETEAQCQRLVDLGVSFGQGWLFGRPDPALPTRPIRPGRRRGVKEEWA